MRSACRAVRPADRAAGANRPRPTTSCTRGGLSGRSLRSGGSHGGPCGRAGWRSGAESPRAGVRHGAEGRPAGGTSLRPRRPTHGPADRDGAPGPSGSGGRGSGGRSPRAVTRTCLPEAAGAVLTARQSVGALWDRPDAERGSSAPLRPAGRRRRAQLTLRALLRNLHRVCQSASHDAENTGSTASRRRGRLARSGAAANQAARRTRKGRCRAAPADPVGPRGGASDPADHGADGGGHEHGSGVVQGGRYGLSQRPEVPGRASRARAHNARDPVKSRNSGPENGTSPAGGWTPNGALTPTKNEREPRDHQCCPEE